jgi:hypothetical protein
VCGGGGRGRAGTEKKGKRKAVYGAGQQRGGLLKTWSTGKAKAPFEFCRRAWLSVVCTLLLISRRFHISVSGVRVIPCSAPLCALSALYKIQERQLAHLPFMTFFCCICRSLHRGVNERKGGLPRSNDSVVFKLRWRSSNPMRLSRAGYQTRTTTTPAVVPSSPAPAPDKTTTRPGRGTEQGGIRGA